MTNSYIANAIIFLFSTAFTLLCYLMILRFLIQLMGVNFYNPICQFVVNITNPFLTNLRRFLPSNRIFDLASIIVGYLSQLLIHSLLPVLLSQSVQILGLLLLSLASFCSKLIGVLSWCIIASALLSWLNQRYNPLIELLQELSSPLLRLTKNKLKSTAGLDFSPVFVLLGLQLIILLIITPLRDFSTSIL